MIWTSLRVGWGNTSAIFALALLPIVLISGAGSKPAGQDQTRIERQQLVLADQPTHDSEPSDLMVAPEVAPAAN